MNPVVAIQSFFGDQKEKLELILNHTIIDRKTFLPFGSTALAAQATNKKVEDITRSGLWRKGKYPFDLQTTRQVQTKMVVVF